MFSLELMVPLSLRKTKKHSLYWKRKGKDPTHRSITTKQRPCLRSYYEYVGWDIYKYLPGNTAAQRPELAFGQGAPPTYYALSVGGAPSVCFLYGLDAMNLKKGIELFRPSRVKVVVTVINT